MSPESPLILSSSLRTFSSSSENLLQRGFWHSGTVKHCEALWSVPASIDGSAPSALPVSAGDEASVLAIKSDSGQCGLMNVSLQTRDKMYWEGLQLILFRNSNTGNQDSDYHSQQHYQTLILYTQYVEITAAPQPHTVTTNHKWNGNCEHSKVYRESHLTTLLYYYWLGVALHEITKKPKCLIRRATNQCGLRTKHFFGIEIHNAIMMQKPGTKAA